MLFEEITRLVVLFEKIKSRRVVYEGIIRRVVFLRKSN